MKQNQPVQGIENNLGTTKDYPDIHIDYLDDINQMNQKNINQLQNKSEIGRKIDFLRGKSSSRSRGRILSSINRIQSKLSNKTLKHDGLKLNENMFSLPGTPRDKKLQSPYHKQSSQIGQKKSRYSEKPGRTQTMGNSPSAYLQQEYFSSYKKNDGRESGNFTERSRRSSRNNSQTKIRLKTEQNGIHENSVNEPYCGSFLNSRETSRSMSRHSRSRSGRKQIKRRKDLAIHNHQLA